MCYTLTTITCQGGNTRSESVLNALKQLIAKAAASDWVLVHDAARPCLSSTELARLLALLHAHPVVVY